MDPYSYGGTSQTNRSGELFVDRLLAGQVNEDHFSGSQLLALVVNRESFSGHRGPKILASGPSPRSYAAHQSYFAALA